MKTSTVPVTRDGLGLEGDFSTEFFGDTVEEPSGDPELITNCQIELANPVSGDAQEWYTYEQFPRRDQLGTPTERA